MPATHVRHEAFSLYVNGILMSFQAKTLDLISETQDDFARRGRRINRPNNNAG